MSDPKSPTAYFFFVVEERIPTLGAWRPAHRPSDDNEGLSEAEADALIERYRRAMPMKEFRKRKIEHVYL